MQNNKGTNLVTISIFSVITLFIWLGAEGYIRLTKKDLKTISPEILNPLTPTLDKNVLNTISSKKYLTPQEISTLKPEYFIKDTQSNTSTALIFEETTQIETQTATNSADQNLNTQQTQQ